MADSDSPRYLYDGRRVQIRDLVRSGHLLVGDRLRFERRRAGETHWVQVTSSGALQADDGESYWTPSRAASEVGSVGAIDGWRAWVVDRLGKTLDAIRSDFLDAIDAETKADRRIAEARTPSAHDRLRQARMAADGGQPRELSVLELLAWWGGESRTPEITQTIDAELANHGLRTSPNFSAVTLETQVRLIMRGHQDEAQAVHVGEPPGRS